MSNERKQKYWFKRRRYGYGWMPVTWQGWLVLAVFAAILIGGGLFFLKDTPRNEFSDEVMIYLGVVIAAILILIWIGLKKGPSPKWRWGSKPTDNPDEDF